MKQIKHHRELINSIIARHSKTIHGLGDDTANQVSIKTGSIGNRPKTSEEVKKELALHLRNSDNNKG